MNLYIKVGSLAALHLGKRNYDVHLYEYREGKCVYNGEACLSESEICFVL